MKKTIWLIVGALLVMFATSPIVYAKKAASTEGKAKVMERYKGEKIVKTDKEWKKILTSEQYEVLRGEGTERACSGLYWDNHEKGVYVCAGCGLPLFVSDSKFDSKTGWPSFFKPVYPENVATRADNSWGMARVEVHCPRCGGHLGHVFEDGPKPTGLRYCINSAAVSFIPEKKMETRPDSQPSSVK